MTKKSKVKKHYTIAEVARMKLIGLGSYKGVYNKIAWGILASTGERHPKKNGKTYGFRFITPEAIQDYRVRHWMDADFSKLVE